MSVTRANASVVLGDAQNLPVSSGSVDLIVTSPTYAANAIDYMRAHKFSLVWLGYPIRNLSRRRRDYIGGESLTHIEMEDLPDNTSQVIRRISQQDARKGRVLHRYYSELSRAIREMFRVLCPDRAAVVVVGSSVMRGQHTDASSCVAEIAQTAGFEIAGIGVRKLERNRRMLPVSTSSNADSQIERRMHEEHVVGLYKPDRPTST